ncbi:MAG: hypothetical protein WA830_07465 [Candidatus Sulfotelmatobacter sp.]
MNTDIWRGYELVVASAIIEMIQQFATHTERVAAMSVQKKSLISNRVAVRKALIASQPAEGEEANSLKINSLTAQSMKKKKMIAFKASPLNFTAFKKR